MKKLILIPFIIVCIVLFGTKDLVRAHDNNDLIIFNDYFGYATYNSKQNMITTSYYVESKDSIYRDTSVYSIPLLTLSKDSLCFLPGQKELISVLNRLSCLREAEVYWIKYSDMDSNQLIINIRGQTMSEIRQNDNIHGGFFILDKLVIIMNCTKKRPDIFFDMFKETSRELKIQFINIPVEDYSPMFFETFQSVTGLLDTINFEILKMKIGPNRPIVSSKLL